MTNSEIKKRLPKIYFIKNLDYSRTFSKKISELYCNNINLTVDSFLTNLQSANKFKNSFPVIFCQNGKLFETVFVKDFPYDIIELSQQNFLKYFEEDYSDKLEFIELSQYEKGLLQISINKFVKDCENFGEELLNIDLNDYVNILGKLSE